MEIWTSVCKSCLIYLINNTLWTITAVSLWLSIAASAYFALACKRFACVLVGNDWSDKKFIKLKGSRAWCACHVLSDFFCKWTRAHAWLDAGQVVSCFLRSFTLLWVLACFHWLLSVPSGIPPPPPCLGNSNQCSTHAFGFSVQSTPLQNSKKLSMV